MCVNVRGSGFWMFKNVRSMVREMRDDQVKLRVVPNQLKQSMISVIPYFAPFSIRLFDIPLDSWSLLVAFGFIVGIEFARSRAQQLIAVKDVVDGGLLSLGWGLWSAILYMWVCTIPI